MKRLDKYGLKAWFNRPGRDEEIALFREKRRQDYADRRDLLLLEVAILRARRLQGEDKSLPGG
jgi:hypothetical protein